MPEQEHAELSATIDDLRAKLAAAEERIGALMSAQTCVSCGCLICPPMQCGRCIETAQPAAGMPQRPATTNLAERLREAEERGRRFESAAKWLVEAYELRQDLSAVMLEFGGLLAQNTSERQRPRA